MHDQEFEAAENALVARMADKNEHPIVRMAAEKTLLEIEHEAILEEMGNAKHFAETPEQFMEQRIAETEAEFDNWEFLP